MSPKGGWLSAFRDQILFSILLTALALAVGGKQQAASAAAGAAITTLNFAILAWSWTRLFAKKSIALAGATIVIKYAFFVGLLFFITRQRWIHGLWLVFGIVSFVPTSLLMSWRAREGVGKD